MRVPTVGEIIDNEDAFNDVICSIVSTPYELMVPLDDAGIDFTKLSCFDVFMMLFKRLQELDTSILFGDFDFSGFRPAQDTETGDIFLYDDRTDTKLDKSAHSRLCVILRKLFNIQANDKKPGNEEARQYMLRRARAKHKRNKRKTDDCSQLESLIIALVNTEQFKYDYSSVRSLSIYQLMDNQLFPLCCCE